MKVLVTGATGFIGTRLVAELTSQGHEVHALVRNPARAPPDCIPLPWNLDEPRPEQLPRQLDAIVHAAQSRGYRAFPANALEMAQVNVAGTVALLDYAAGIGVEKFCLLSSGTVYEPYRVELTEDARLDPTSYLGATKLAAEILARPYGALFPIAVLRLFFPYGPGQKNRLIPDLISRVRAGKPVVLASDGEGLRLVPTYVDDIAKVITCALNDGWSGIFNVAAPTAVSIRRLAETIAGVVGGTPAFEIVAEAPLTIVPRLDRLSGRFDLGRFTSLEDGIRRTAAS